MVSLIMALISHSYWVSIKNFLIISHNWYNHPLLFSLCQRPKVGNIVFFHSFLMRSCTTTLTAQAWAGPTSIPRGAVWGGSSMYSFKAEPFQQWSLRTDMMIGLGRAGGLLRTPVGTSAWERDPQTYTWDSPFTWEWRRET